MRQLSFCAITALAWVGCAGQPAVAPSDAAAPPLFAGLGDHHRQVAASDELTQRYFDQGLMLCYAFNHDEAVRAFRAARRIDPQCAMAWWGEGFALGPNINLPLEDPEIAERAHAAAQQAFALRERESGANRALIEALVARYAAPAPADRKPLDRAWAEAMREVWRAFPGDCDVGALFAESLLDINPWQTWSKDGQPLENVEEVVATIEAVQALDPYHPLANHLYIHALEASPHPERAIPAAERLGTFAPAAGHLVHMPAHIYINVGRYFDAEEANRKAVAADRAYFAEVGPQGIYEFYRAHNHHFRAYAAMFGGRSEVALEAARGLVADLPEHVLRDLAPLVDGFLAVPLHVLIRFGRWDEVLAEPRPGDSFPVARTLWHYARGVALAATGRVAEARAEQQAFETAAAAVPEDAVIGINPAAPVLVVARHMLAGEVLYREGRFDAAFAELRRAVEAEDGLRYDEPSPWMQPVRHALGALLLEQGRVAEAEEVYRADLERHEENGWSLHGLAECARRRDDEVAARGYAERFAAAWSHADVELRASCFCRTVAGAAAPSCCDGRSG